MRDHQGRHPAAGPGPRQEGGRGWDEQSGGGEGPRHPGRPHEHRGPGPRAPRAERAERGGRPGRSRGRAQRGDVRAAILLLLAEQPMHGYQIMEAISDRTGGAWRPSPGAVYPTIAQLEDEGLAGTQQDGGRRLVTLTPVGHAHLEEHRAQLGDPFADFAGGVGGPDLREPLHDLHLAARQIAAGGRTAQVEGAARVLADAKRSLYLILAGDSEGTDE